MDLEVLEVLPMREVFEEWSQGHVREARLPSSDFKDVETEGKR